MITYSEKPTNITGRSDTRTVYADVMHGLGCDFISSSRQIENGTLVWEDPETGHRYAVYANGYVRRFVRQDYLRGHRVPAHYSGYTLNRRYRANSGRQFIQRASTPEEALGTLVKGVSNGRLTGWKQAIYEKLSKM